MTKNTSNAKPPLRAKLNPLSWLGRHWWQLVLIMLVALAGYAIYLDAMIKHQFSGNKWQVPAQIFARPLVLELKQEITRGEIAEELQLLGYRPVASPNKSGEYHISGDKIHIVRRAFDFPSGFEPQLNMQIMLSAGRISEIKNLAQGSALQRVKLEPWLVTRLVSSGREDRMLVNLEQVPQILTQALVLVEDQDFYNHHGIAPLSIIRALFANIAAGKTVQGGSTLTQQLVKNLYLSREKSIIRKAKEALMALLIDARYSKDEIIEAYLNEVFLGQNGQMGVYGFGLASYFYFDRPLTELNQAELATLVGMIKGPSFYNPRRYPERVLERRNLVLRILFENNVLQTNEYKKLITSPLGIATGASLAKDKHPAFMDQVKRELRLVMDNPDIRQSGLKVFTSLDSNAQRKAELAMINDIPKLEKQKKIKGLEGAMVITDIDSGEVRAIVGASDPNFDGFNRALDAKRNIGSLIKPAIYLTALEQAASYNLASPLKDEPIKLKSSYGNYWEPQNSDKQFRGQVSLLTALTHSLNVPTVGLGMELGLNTIADTLQRLGVQDDIRLFPALTLGALELSPMTVNQMYQGIANNGLYIPLHTLTAVMSPDNDVLWQYSSLAEQRIDPQATYLLNYALHKVTLEGTAKKIRTLFPSINMAGKTGTTDDYRDSWFSGFDKNVLITTWLGKDDNTPTGLTGASGALELFLDYQSSQAPKSLVRRFPQGLDIAHFDIATGELTKGGCPNSISVPAISAALPPAVNTCYGQNKPIQKIKGWWESLFGG
jgi:penicillin-binding protein 1B